MPDKTKNYQKKAFYCKKNDNLSIYFIFCLVKSFVLCIFAG